ncbi:MAG: hypothetical protein GX421_07195 [Caldisericales bacterium]|nr:hypothetical protein [Caldisericales bacterium]
MKKTLFVLLTIMVLAGCGRREVVFVGTHETTWGSVGVAAGWKAEPVNKSDVNLYSIEEHNVKLTIRLLPFPKDLAGYIEGQAKLTGREFVGSEDVELGGGEAKKFRMKAVYAKLNLIEDLYAVKIGDQLLSILVSVPEESMTGYQAEQVANSVRWNGGR